MLGNARRSPQVLDWNDLEVFKKRAAFELKYYLV
jgi:hypothetical protein